eukprot:5260943-Lingulodinium_polyedra.AAC.1
MDRRTDRETDRQPGSRTTRQPDIQTTRQSWDAGGGRGGCWRWRTTMSGPGTPENAGVRWVARMWAYAPNGPGCQ